VWGQDNEQFWWFFQTKNSNSKNILNDLEMENLRRLIFIHTKLKLLTKASILCVSHPSMSITTWFMSVFAIACVRKIMHSQGYKWKTTTYKIMKICSFSYPWYFKSTKYE
jgi:hypothetical protein